MNAGRDHRSLAHRWRATSRRRRWALGITALVLGLLVLLVLLFDWNWFKAPVERAVQVRLDREFRIGGDLDVDLGRTITVRADRPSLANAAWSDEARMAAAERVEIDIALWPLFRWHVRIPEIRLTRPDVLLETGPDGESGNWIFRPGQDGDGDPPDIRRLWIEAGRLRFVDAGAKTDIDVALDSSTERPDAAPAVDLAGKGRWRGAPFTLEGRAESPLELTATDRPYRIDLQGAAGATRAHVGGTLTNPFQFRRFDLRMRLEGRDMQDLYPLVGIAIPPTPPYRLDGRFVREGDLWKYQGFTGQVGDSDLSGDAEIEAGGDKPHLRAELASRRLDFDDLAGFVGGTPRAEGDGARGDAGAGPSPARVLPDTPYDLAKLRAMDADVRLRAQRIEAPRLPLQDMQAHLLLEDGLLRLQPLDFGVADGNIRSEIRMDARTDTIRTSVQGAVRGLQLGKLFPDAELAQEAVGRITGNFDLAGEGNSIARMLGSADGEVAIGMGRGRIGNLVMELAGLDIAESLKYLLTRDRQIPIRCAFGEFEVKDGVMHAGALAFDTTDTLLIGEGSISLKEERLDLLIRPRPKDISILSLRSPLRIGGSFADPSFRPDMKALGLRGALALTLASIAPPAALLATFETGPGEDSGCGGQYAK